MTIVKRYECICCGESFEKHRIHGFDWQDGVWGELEFDDPDSTGKHICRVCQNELGRMIGNVPPEPKPPKPVAGVIYECRACDQEFPDEESLDAHIEQCPKHPLAAAKAEIERLTKELADLRDSMSMGLLLWPEAKNYLDITEASFSVRADDLREMVAAKAEAGQLRKELDIHHAKFTNCYSVWSNGQLVKCRGASGDPYENAQKTSFPVMLRADDFRLMVEALEIVRAIETIRKGGGRLSVHQIDELDPRTSIGVCGDWTHEEWQTFRGDTLHAALAWAVEARLEKR